MALLYKFAENSNFFAARFGSPGPLLECMGTAFTTLILVLFIAIKAIINAKKSPVQGDRDPELEAQRDGRDPVSNASCNQPTQLTPPNISGLKADGGVGWL